MSELLHEIQAADMLGFQRMSDFRRALKAGQIPEPQSIDIGKKRVEVWSRRALQAWIDADDRSSSDLSRAIKSYADNRYAS